METGATKKLLFEIHKRLENQELGLDDLLDIKKDLMKLHLQFMYTRTTDNQILDICNRKTMNGQIFDDLIKMAVSEHRDPFEALHPDSKFLRSLAWF